MLGVRSAGQREYSHAACEAKHNLGRSRVGARSELHEPSIMQHFYVCREQRETLIADLSFLAKQTHIPIPFQASEAAVLHERRPVGVGGHHLLKVLEGNVAYAKKTGSASVTLVAHCFPDLAVSVAPTQGRCGPMQHIAVDVVGSEMLKRTGQRLSHLKGEAGFRIIGQPMILTILIGEFRL